jgi:RNA polymerase sigma factor (sigma-70 family)
MLAMSAVNLLDENLLLWNEFRSGKTDAFRQLIRIHYQDLYNYGSRFTRDEDIVKDCIQDLFLSLWTNRLTISENSFVKYYLLKTLRRHLARAIGQSKYYNGWSELHFEALFRDSSSIEGRLIREDLLVEPARKMRKVLTGLSRRQQEAIYLRFYLDADIEEIADIMSLNRQSVYNLLHDALKRLRKISFDPEDLVFSRSFRSWVLGSEAGEAGFWENWLMRHPEKFELVQNAKAIIYALQLNLRHLSTVEIEEEIRRAMFRLRDIQLTSPLRDMPTERRRGWGRRLGAILFRYLRWSHRRRGR